MECKFDDLGSLAGEYIRINRNIVECKFDRFIVNRFCYFYELIETLWNVNEQCSGALGDWIAELIETLWNVNK